MAKASKIVIIGGPISGKRGEKYKQQRAQRKKLRNTERELAKNGR